MAGLIGNGLVIGLLATVVFDIWALILNRSMGIPLPNWGMVGRWFLHIPRGQLMHENIAAAPTLAGERGWGWFFHYAVGGVFGIATALIGGKAWLAQPTLLLPLAVGWITVLCGWLILQPGMGAGIAASRKPDAMRIRVLNIIAHTVFGLAMYMIALILR